MEPNHSIKSSFSYNGVDAAKEKEAFADYQRILALIAEVSAQSRQHVAFDMKMREAPSSSEHPPLPASPPPERSEAVCDVCCLPCRGYDDVRGFCGICANIYEDALKNHPEEVAEATLESQDAVRLLVLRLSAESIRQEEEDAEVYYCGARGPGPMEAFLNRRAAELVECLPVCFAPWWKKRWTYEKWCDVWVARKAEDWAVSEAAPILRRLAAMFVAEKHKTHELENLREEMEAAKGQHNHEIEALEKAHEDEMRAVEKAHEDEMRAVEEHHKREMETEEVCYTKAPKHNYNHPLWPSPKTKRFALHIAANSGTTPPKTIKTHAEALDFLAQRANISVKYLLNIDLKTYQERYARWSIYGGGGTSPLYPGNYDESRVWWY